MRVALDISPLFNDNKFRGIGRYTYYLKNELSKNSEVELLTFKKGEKIPEADIVHYPYFDPFFLTLPLNKKYPTVVTIHDMIPFVFPRYFPRGVRGEIKWQIQKASLKSIKAIITDSECSKKDISKFTGIDRDKIHVVNLAPSIQQREIDEKTKQQVKEKFHLPDRFLLYVGDINHNKNIPRLFEALKLLKEKIYLVLVGPAFLDKNLKEKIELDRLAKQLNIENILLKIGKVEEEELRALYSLAYAYIHPSLYEGFGLPVLDAMSIGCPVITSREGSLREITDEAAVFIDPYNPKSIADGIETLFHYDTVKYHSMIKIGKENTAKFSWTKTAREAVIIYKKVLKTQEKII